MPQISRGPRVFVHAAINYLGHKVPEKPARGDKSAAAKEVRRLRLRRIKTFHQAIVEGRAPAADGRQGRSLWWYQSTLDEWIAATANSKRGRKPKAEVTDASAA